jgi:4-oxalocrotonate tautomerase family enzyme
MPYIQCHIAAGLSKQRKSQLVRDIVRVTNAAIGSDPKIINVLLVEHPAENMSISGRVSATAAARKRS